MNAQPGDKSFDSVDEGKEKKFEILLAQLFISRRKINDGIY